MSQASWDSDTALWPEEHGRSAPRPRRLKPLGRTAERRGPACPTSRGQHLQHDHSRHLLRSVRPDEQETRGSPVTWQRSQVLLQSQGVHRPAAGLVIKHGSVLRCHPSGILIHRSMQPVSSVFLCALLALKNHYSGKGLITRHQTDRGAHDHRLWGSTCSKGTGWPHL